MTNTIGKPKFRSTRPITQREARGVVPARRADPATYRYHHGVHELRLKLYEPTPSEIQDVREGAAEFALVIEDPVIVLCARFGETVPWRAAVFDGVETPRTSGTLPPASHVAEETRALLNTALIDPGSGQTLVERNVTLWLDFTRVLHEAILDRCRFTVHPADYERALARLRRRYPDDAALAASSVVRSLGSL